MASKADDCYFYYYSTCAKGTTCPFRHEPSALAQEVVCTFWKAGNCTKPNCYFRHMEVNKKRNTIPCYWESQPTGCKKPHCPFLHETPKGPYPEEVSELLEKPNQSIIVNPNKMSEFNSLILPVQPGKQSLIPERTVIAPSNVKSRLGIQGDLRSKIGFKRSHPREETYAETSDILRAEEEEAAVVEAFDSDGEDLRKKARLSLDLRARLDKRSTRRVSDGIESEEMVPLGERNLREITRTFVNDRETKSPDSTTAPLKTAKKAKDEVKKLKKAKKLKKEKKEKKAKKKKKLKRRVVNPKNENSSDEEEDPSSEVGDSENEEYSLAVRVAEARARGSPLKSVKKAKKSSMSSSLVDKTKRRPKKKEKVSKRKSKKEEILLNEESNYSESSKSSFKETEMSGNNSKFEEENEPDSMDEMEKMLKDDGNQTSAKLADL